jgi:hypothetical protein
MCHERLTAAKIMRGQTCRKKLVIRTYVETMQPCRSEMFKGAANALLSRDALCSGGDRMQPSESNEAILPTRF